MLDGESHRFCYQCRVSWVECEPQTKNKQTKTDTHQLIHMQRNFQRIPAPRPHNVKLLNKSPSRKTEVLFKLLPKCWDLDQVSFSSVL